MERRRKRAHGRGGLVSDGQQSEEGRASLVTNGRPLESSRSYVERAETLRVHILQRPGHVYPKRSLD